MDTQISRINTVQVLEELMLLLKLQVSTAHLNQSCLVVLIKIVHRKG